MKTRTLIGTALLLSTAGLGVALAATQVDHLDRLRHSRDPAARADTRSLRLADNDQAQGDRHRGHNDDDDDDDDDDDGDDEHSGGRRGAVPQTGATNPAAPVPDNGLFQGKAPPKVEVQ